MKKKLYAGDSINESITVAAYPASAGYTLKVRFAPIGSGTPLTVTSATADDGEGYVLTVPASATAGWNAGQWTYTQWVEKPDERHTIESGELQVLANPANATEGIDARSHVKKTLDALELVIEGKASSDVQNYTINGRSLAHYSFPDLLMLRDKYKAEYYREQRVKNGKLGGRGRTLHVRM